MVSGGVVDVGAFNPSVPLLYSKDWPLLYSATVKGQTNQLSLVPSSDKHALSNKRTITIRLFSEGI